MKLAYENCRSVIISYRKYVHSTLLHNFNKVLQGKSNEQTNVVVSNCSHHNIDLISASVPEKDKNFGVYNMAYFSSKTLKVQIGQEIKGSDHSKFNCQKISLMVELFREMMILIDHQDNVI